MHMAYFKYPTLPYATPHCPSLPLGVLWTRGTHFHFISLFQTQFPSAALGKKCAWQQTELKIWKKITTKPKLGAEVAKNETKKNKK